MVLINKVNIFGGLWNKSKTKEFTAPLANWSSEMCTHKLRSTKEKAVHLVSSGFKGDPFCPPSVFSPPFLSVRSRKWHAENLADQREKNAWVVMMIIHQDKWSWWTECHLKVNQPWKAKSMVNASSSIADITVISGLDIRSRRVILYCTDHLPSLHVVSHKQISAFEAQL